MQDIKWEIKAFDKLDTLDLYEVMKLRQDVFIIEQTCIYPDLDNLDQKAIHVSGRREGRLVAYARILPPGIAYDKCAIGRVLTLSSERGKGTGKALLVKVLDYIDQVMKETEIKISAQSYLIDFYGSFGFVKVSDEYLEDGIPHVDMIRN